ncbi:akirin-1 isoform X2 [Rhinatrema bivittatum]|uniref:akirin-1 isoform X2 n=1 Tax=Rhinatrema bivittatum TaxID=194408 RepID=UPI00112B3125|nr:akirin-1 isoform X2 [Rhinatrema bivittatum]
MTCGATLKRSREFDALLSPQSHPAKQRRCAPLPSSLGTPSPPRCSLQPPEAQPQIPPQMLLLHAERRLTPEQIYQNLKEEYCRYQRQRQLEVAFNRNETGPSDEAQLHCSAIAAPSSPGAFSMRKDQPSFTLRQVGILCEHLLKDHEGKIRQEYEQILNTKLAEQYESFVRFTHNQIMQRYGARPASYVS